MAAVYLAPFVTDPERLPFGNDTAGYLWRASLVHDEGVGALGDAERGLGERPTHPIVVSTFRGVAGAPPLTAAWVAPAVLAVAVALAAGALATDGLREPRRRSAAYAVGVGASGFIAWTAVGYAANLMLDPVALALVLAAILAAFTRRGVLAGIALVLGAALIHWMFALVILGLLLALAVALALGARLPGVWAPPDDAARRVLLLLGGGVVAGVVGLGLSPAFPSHVFLVEPGTSGDAKAEQRLPGLALWLTLPLGPRRGRARPVARVGSAALGDGRPPGLGSPRPHEPHRLVRPRPAGASVPVDRVRAGGSATRRFRRRLPRRARPGPVRACRPSADDRTARGHRRRARPRGRPGLGSRGGEPGGRWVRAARSHGAIPR